MRADLGEASYDVVVESGVLERFFADMAENFNVLVIMDSELKDIVEHNCPSIKKIKNENIFLLPARKESKNLYSLLRKIKNDGYKMIAVEKIKNEGIGKTINDRLIRASKY